MRTALIAIGCAAAGLTACGGDSSSSSVGKGSARDRALDGAVAYARCMRENGVDIPDPTTGEGGMVKIGPGPGGGGGGPDPASPAFARADGKCRQHLERGGGAPDPQMSEEHRDAFVAYARCMREHGVDMPDPGPDGGLTFKVGDPNAPDPESPQFKRADEACHKHLAELDEAIEEQSP
jgi:hypothetical protein